MAQTLDWARRVRELVDDANRVLQPSFDAQLEIESMDAWNVGDKSAGVEENMDAALAALKIADPGDDVDWVGGLVGALPRLTVSFHELGKAEFLSKHLVLRAAGNAGEHDGIDRSFDELDEEARAKLRNQRRSHRATAIFLHELGHTLGAVHEPNRRSLMYFEYRTDMEAFDEGARSWVAVSLAHRTDHRVLDDRDAFAAAVLPSLRTATNWVPRERDELVARLEPKPAAPVQEAPAPVKAQVAEAPPAAPVPEDVAALPAEARERYAQVLEAKGAGDVAGARASGKALFAKYVKVYSVQDLRCQLATATASGLAWPVARAECEPLMKLARDPKRVR